MKLTIRLEPKELDDSLLDLIKDLTKKHGFYEMSINLSNKKPSKRLRRETPEEVKERLERAVVELNSGETSHLISFSAQEFEHFSNRLKKA